MQLTAAGDVHSGHDQRLVHGQHDRAVSRDTAFVAQRLRNRPAQHDAAVLHGVVRVHINVAGGLHGQVEQAVAPESVQHMVEERHAGVDIRSARSVQIDGQHDVRLLRGARKLREATLASRVGHVPTSVPRKYPAAHQ